MGLIPHLLVIWLWKRGKLGPQFIGPFRINARVAKDAYRLDLPYELSQIHNLSMYLNGGSM